MKLKCHGTDGLDAEQFDSFIDEALRNEERKEILEVLALWFCKTFYFSADLLVFRTLIISLVFL